MARKQPITSKLSYQKITQPGVLESHYKKIFEAVKEYGRGTSWEISKFTNLKYPGKGLTPDQVWKRIKKMLEAEILIDTRLFGLSDTGNPAMIYDLITNAHLYSLTPKPERQKKGVKTTGHYAGEILKSQTFVKPPTKQLEFFE